MSFKKHITEKNTHIGENFVPLKHGFYFICFKHDFECNNFAGNIFGLHVKGPLIDEHVIFKITWRYKVFNIYQVHCGLC